MITQKMTDVLNGQINKEIFSAYLYASMEVWFAQSGLDGFANWMRVQSQEELKHARKIMDYILERGGIIRLNSIDTPQNDWKNIREVFDKSYEHEKYITSEINKLCHYADEEDDRATGIFLQWFVTEQVEEEDSVRKIIDKLKLTECTGDAIFHLDTAFKDRKFEN